MSSEKLALYCRTALSAKDLKSYPIVNQELVSPLNRGKS